MQLILIPDREHKKYDLFESVLNDSAVAFPVMHCLKRQMSMGSRPILALPKKLSEHIFMSQAETIFHEKTLPLTFGRDLYRSCQLLISNGTRIFHVNCLDHRLRETQKYFDIVIVKFDPDIYGFSENMKLVSNGKIAGIRRIYSPGPYESSLPNDWPDYVYIRASALTRVFPNLALPTAFDEFIKQCTNEKLDIASFKIGGDVYHLDHAWGMLKLLDYLDQAIESKFTSPAKIKKTARITGPVMLGKNVHIGCDTVIAGPVIIGDNVVIGENCLIHNSIISSGSTIKASTSFKNRIESASLKSVTNEEKTKSAIKNEVRLRRQPPRFRVWPKLSYAKFLKRIIDLFAAGSILIFIAPIFPAIALVIKLNSRGPIFFKHRRQGLHGREFDCIKFRTMVVGADELQSKLRSCNQVDGPQFRIENDPRVTFVGKFLRDTYIDELPQFINVIKGEMSLIGPRPSPERENSLCPRWRDARLSVRPGVTGMWQVYRTRAQGHDFQEWIYYDIKYVKELSFKLDAKIFYLTISKMIGNFIDRF